MAWIVTEAHGYSEEWRSRIKEIKVNYFNSQKSGLLLKGTEDDPAKADIQIRSGICREWANPDTGEMAVVLYVGKMDFYTKENGWYAFYRSKDGETMNLHPETSKENPLAKYNTSPTAEKFPEAILNLGDDLKNLVHQRLTTEDNSPGLVQL